MAKLNLKRLSVEDLVRLRDEIETALSGKIAMERKELQEKINALDSFQNKRAGTRAETTREPRRVNPAKGKKAAPKYRGPNGETWAGRGLAPRWLVELEKKGKKRESFLIAQ
jgi:DNA-binding protein H-NS